MVRATELASLVGDELVEAALALAAEAGRFADGDLESILEHLRARPGGRWAARTPLPDPAGSLQPGTAAWEAVGR